MVRPWARMTTIDMAVARKDFSSVVEAANKGERKMLRAVHNAIDRRFDRR
jgi:hypothetical protein